MKKNFILLFIISSLVFLTACSKEENKENNISKKEVVSFYNWGGVLTDDILKQFEDETGIDIIYSEFDENENMYTVVKNSPSDYDLIAPSEYMVEKMIDEGMLREIDHSKLSNISNIGKEFMDREFDPNNKYSIPMIYGTLGILYNKTKVDTQDLHNWDIIFNEKYKKQIWMLDSSRDTLGPGAWHLGYSANTKNEKELNEIRDLMKEQKNLVTAYLQDEIKQHMINGVGAVAVIYSGEAWAAMSENSDLDYYLPPKSNLWIDNFAIPKDAKNYENALKLIDFLSRPDIAAKIGLEQGTPVTAAWDLEPVKSIENFDVMYPDLSNFDEKEVYVDLGEFIEIFEEAWEEVKIY